MDGAPQLHLPDAFCWTRFGTEAGEAITEILQRKEAERLANDGTFFWGIGNSVAPGIAELVRKRRQPELLFSPIKGRPRATDVEPQAVVRWRSAETVHGDVFRVPDAVRITSRMAAGKRWHYALIGSSEQPLELANHGQLAFGALQNLLSGRSVGPSQVTAVVRLLREALVEGAIYAVALRVRLVYPYFVRLLDPVRIEGRGVVEARLRSETTPRRAQMRLGLDGPS
jgi:hypothetical protein